MIYETLKNIEQLEKEAQRKIPFEISRLLSGTTRAPFNISGAQISLANTDADYGNIQEWRRAIDWLVKEFGGKKVTWKQQ